MTSTPTSKRALAAALATLAFLLVSAGSLPTARALTNCTVSAADLAVDSEEAQLLDLINAYRVANGRNPLLMDPGLTRAAAWFSRDMATFDYFPANHVDRLGRDIPTRLTQCDVTYSSWGENIAAGNPTAEATFEQWRTSPTHNTIMLTAGFTHAGIGRAFDVSSTFDWYWTLDVASGIPSTTSTSTTSTTSTSTTTTLPPTTTSTSTTTPLPPPPPSTSTTPPRPP
ncbi:MAG TPA: CAP domain-containing protein, partial [Acidimicrobiales bacterium]|nr:CAP domain-containing protein [Acidimicrobiales bacterium]